MNLKMLGDMKTTEDVFEFKESTKESQGEYFCLIVGFCRKTMNDYRPFSKDYQKTLKDYGKTMAYHERLLRIVKGL